jgi:hypothetical protein
MRFPACLSALTALALSGVEPAAAADSRTVERGGITLVFQDESDAMDDAVANRMVETFFAVYGRMSARFNPDASRRVTFIVDPALEGIAGADGATVYFNPAYFAEHPQDTDVVVHEAMHVVQDYGQQPVPGWLVEGIADYVRHQYGVNDAVGGWKLREYSPDQGVEGGYRSTGRFLVWLEANGHPGLVETLDRRARAGAYTDAVWSELTGQTLTELWAAYAADPVIG